MANSYSSLVEQPISFDYLDDCSGISVIFRDHSKVAVDMRILRAPRVLSVFLFEVLISRKPSGLGRYHLIGNKKANLERSAYFSEKLGKNREELLRKVFSLLRSSQDRSLERAIT